MAIFAIIAIFTILAYCVVKNKTVFWTFGRLNR